jgi:hypothetical protein
VISARIDDELNRRVSAADVQAALDGDISPAEREAFTELVTWFRTRYPTPEARLAYVRRTYRQWAGRRRP